MGKVLAYCQRYANSFTPESRGLMFIGSAGLGKTHMALAIADTVLNRGFDVLYTSSAALAAQLGREHFDRAAEDPWLDACKEADLLILDEPTNHMDIVGKEALEQMLKSYTGTVLFVSHDRYFIKEIATGILDFQADKVQYYPCTYEEYLEQKQKEAQGLIGGNKTNAAGNSGKSRNVAGEAADNRNISQVGSQSNPPTLSDVFDKKTYYNPGKIISRLKQQLVKYEKMLGESEERLAELQMQQMDTALATDYEKLTELEQAIAAEQSNQESILDRLVETETELDEMQEKTV